MNGKWVEPDIRDQVVETIDVYLSKSELPQKTLVGWVGISMSKFHLWKNRVGTPLEHNAKQPKRGWLLAQEREAVIKYAKSHPGEGYRRLTYMMIDEDVVYCSPSTVYRILKHAGLLNKWNQIKSSSKGSGYKQPIVPHQQWHTDIKFVNFKGSFLFLISVIDGYSRYIVHHELRSSMQELDVQETVQKALDKFPDYKPRIITDNGSQYISRDFAHFIKFAGLEHVRISVKYPQSNGKIERFHRTIQNECIRKTALLSIGDAQQQIQEFVEYYNRKRLHSSLYYLTPEDYLEGRVTERLKVREEKLQQAELKRMMPKSA